MKKLITIFIALVALPALAGPLFAAGEKKVTSAEELLGMRIVSQAGEEIGEIKDIKFDSESGEVKFITLSRSDALGVEAGEVAAPLGAFEFDTLNDRATLTVDESRLDTAPRQVDLYDENFQSDLESHYGVSPAWEHDSESMMEDPDKIDDPHYGTEEAAPQTNIDSQDRKNGTKFLYKDKVRTDY
jgi:sporulation protein YlmC with PRC-barrel domain